MERYCRKSRRPNHLTRSCSSSGSRESTGMEVWCFGVEVVGKAGGGRMVFVVEFEGRDGGLFVWTGGPACRFCNHIHQIPCLPPI